MSNEALVTYLLTYLLTSFWHCSSCWQVTNMPPPFGACGSVPLECFPVYTVATCSLECKTRFVFQRCGCVDMYNVYADKWWYWSKNSYKLWYWWRSMLSIDSRVCYRTSSSVKPFSTGALEDVLEGCMTDESAITNVFNHGGSSVSDNEPLWFWNCLHSLCS